MQVEPIEALENGRLHVRSPYGSFTADWHGEKPTVGTVHFVELEVDGPILWGQDLTVGEDPISKIADDRDSVRISGRIESFNEDDVLVLSLDGSSIMVDTDGDPPLDITGRYATLRSKKVALYPYTL